LFTVIGTRGVAGRSAWLLVAAGVFLNSSGILVEAIVYRLNPDAIVAGLVQSSPAFAPTTSQVCG
jgi:hypothetical protein